MVGKVGKRISIVQGARYKIWNESLEDYESAHTTEKRKTATNQFGGLWRWRGFSLPLN